MMMLSKLSRASSVRPQQPLIRPRFTSQSFQRSVHSPRPRAKVTAAEVFLDVAVTLIALYYIQRYFDTVPKQAHENTKLDSKVTPEQDVFASGFEEEDGKRY
jgi:hypothetical protein